MGGERLQKMQPECSGDGGNAKGRRKMSSQ